VAVDDIRATMKPIEAAGGKILGAMDETGKHSNEAQQIPDVGAWISVMDTEGNRLSVLQPKGM
jgi:predicted enzyme related to lactoylglutathione lyase